ncbi:carbohydrate kinase family protein [Nocardia sp. NPDC046763]|uniref:carbohydrate kinase family protein n=1 Tax=Nocardia sp. NPDC046763 TaxID=3155256 RepID=UPI0033D761EF
MASDETPRNAGPAKVPQDPGMAAVRGILIGLRKRSGLSLVRLDNTEIDTTALLQLSIVRRYAHRLRTTPQAAASAVISQAAGQLPATLRLIIDAELCLGLLRETSPAGIDLEHLYAPDLGERRRFLTLRWRELHEAWQTDDIPPAPTVRSLRGAPETQAFTALATLLVSGSVPITPGSGTVMIVGDAVIDDIYVVEEIPQVGRSVWGDHRRHPGGKGLNRAVALARFGLDVRLMTAVGDDAEGRWVQDYLTENDVDTSLIRVKLRARTPVTAVLMTLSGQYGAIAFKESRLRLDEDDLNALPTRQVISQSKAVVITFEQSVDVVEQVLRVVDALKAGRRGAAKAPWLIVNVSPAQVLPMAIHRYLRAIDYLIGTPAELESLWPGESSDEAVKRILCFGTDAVCVLDGSRCAVYRSRHAPLEISRTPVVLPGAAGAASAFASALTYRLVTSGRRADREDFEWAMAAMAATEPVFNADAMPSMERVEDFAARDGSDPSD